MNKLFVAYKPPYLTSNGFLYRLRKKYKNWDCGFSGTLDPFAKGCLVVAFGQYTKLFRFFKKTQKTYRATIWLGARSDSLDIENIYEISITEELDNAKVRQNIEDVVGNIEYLPPKYSAKWVDGVRAYKLVRSGAEFELKKSLMTVYDVKFLFYRHPFISFEVTVSEGAYVRSLAQIIVENLETFGTLSYLERLSEGEFSYENEKALNPINFLNLPQNKYFGSKDNFKDGSKLKIDDFECKENGDYLLVYDEFLTIINITQTQVKYVLNNIRRGTDGN